MKEVKEMEEVEEQKEVEGAGLRVIRLQLEMPEFRVNGGAELR